MKSKMVFYTMIFILVVQAGCAAQPTPSYSLNATINGQPPVSLVVNKGEACYQGSRGYALRFSAKADIGPEAVWPEINLRLNIEFNDIAILTIGEPIEVANNSKIHLSTSASGEDFRGGRLYDLLTTVTGTITITALSEKEISGTASLVFTDPENFNPIVEDSIIYQMAFNHLSVNHDCASFATQDIQFVLNDVYRVGELIQVKIKNAGQVSYFYTRRFAACDLSYFDASGRKFLIPPGTHCDLREYVEIRPGETAELFEWDLSECIEDLFGCVKSQPLPPGTYTIRGAFSSFPDGDLTTTAEAMIEIVDE